MFAKQFLAVMASIATAAAVSVTATTQNAKFDPKGNTNMAVYWGQGPDQPRLAHFCADASIDIIPIAFLNIFPDQVNGGYPGTNFGNQCGPETFENKDGTTSPLLSNCPFIGPDIKTCQAMGKKILLSLGGAIPNNQSVKNDDSARSFAKFLWNAFGPVDATYDGPRPFGDAVVDGFDFDIESAISDNDASTQYRGYGTMIDTLRIYFAADVRKQYYISGSPQCVIPDAHLAHPIETSWFDFLFIQFYNTPHCSARAYFDANYGKQGDEPSHISFDAWVGFIRTMAMNKDVKLYLGLPAAPSTQLAYDIKMYIAPDDVINLIELFQCRYPQEFGGIMVYEATYSEQNQIGGKPFVDVIKGQLTDCDCAKKPVTSTTLSSTSTSFSSSATVSTMSSSTVTTLPLTTSSTSTPSASASLPTYPSSTGIWNSTTSTSGPTVPIGTGPTSMTYPSSTGLWNTTSAVPVGTGSSSIVPYPTSTGLWNATYIPSPTAPGTSGAGSTSSSAPVNTSTPSSSTDYASTFSSQLTGPSAGFPSSVLVTSVPYPVNNGTSWTTTSASGGIIYTTQTITVTSCPPEVTSCPIRTSVTTYPVTTSSRITVITSPTNSPETISSAPGSLVTPSVPVSTTLKSQEVTTTIIVTSYTTTCPVTGTMTVHGSTSVYTTSTVSTVTTTLVSTVSVVPTAASGTQSSGHGQGPAPIPSPTHGATSNVAAPSSGSGNSPIATGSQPPSQPQQPAQGGSSGPSYSNSLPPSSNGNSPVGSGLHSPSQPQQAAQEGSSSSSQGSSSPSPGNDNSPIISTGSSPGSSSGLGNTAPNSGSSPVQIQQSPAPASSATSGIANSPIGAGNSPQGPAPPGLITTLQTSTKQTTATLQGNSPVGTGLAAAPSANSLEGSSSSSLPAVVTETIVPVPLHPYQTARPAGSSSTGGLSPVQASPIASPVSNVPFPASNGTVPAGATGSSAPSASAVGTGALSPTAIPFTGAGSTMGSSAVALMLAVVATLLI